MVSRVEALVLRGSTETRRGSSVTVRSNTENTAWWVPSSFGFGIGGGQVLVFLSRPMENLLSIIIIQANH